MDRKKVQDEQNGYADSANRGFTLFEILLVIGLITAMFALGLLFNIDLYRQKILGAERDTIVSVLKKARSEAQNNVNQSPHGVYFGLTSNYVVFQGDTYASRDAAQDELFARSSGINVSGISELTFSQLDANSSVSGTVTVANSQQSADVAINYQGRIDW
ncbi:MAG: hypothetical protein HY432_00585 [Candidatus Liptonbacteria bacterium]|nr:hypothetical protein [Candidatus Liptonbacteria bacterium]